MLAKRCQWFEQYAAEGPYSLAPASRAVVGDVPPDNMANVASLLELASVKVQSSLVPRSNHGCGNAAGGPCALIGVYAMERVS